MDRPDTYADFILVHGAFGDASVWASVVPLLQAGGAEVTAITLAAHSDADNANAGRTTLEDYIEQTREAIAAAAKPVILVGHSLAGMVIGGAAEAIPQKVEALVFVCAVLPENGRSLMSYASTDPGSKFAEHFQPDPALGVATISRKGLLEAVFNRTNADLAAAATATIRDEPLQPFLAEAHLTPDRFGGVARFYVATEHDRALTPSLQSAMYAAQPCEQIYSLDADHAPMLSAPHALADALLDVRARTKLAM
jgi:pimeloyl-ACP methyl ester carboxylesterase